MEHATSQQNVESDEHIGISFVCVRLEEPFDRILANNPELKIEQKATGEVVFMSPTGGESGRRNSKLCFQLESWAIKYGGFCFDSSTLFRLPNGAKRSPDASWIASERWMQLSKDDRRAYPPLCPDFVIELRSDTDPLKELKEKMEEYIDNGARLGWLIDPICRAVYICKPGNSAVCFQNIQTVSDDEILPGFVLDLASIWADSI